MKTVFFVCLIIVGNISLAQSSALSSLGNRDLIFTVGTLNAGSVPGYITGAPPQFLLEIRIVGGDGNKSYKTVTLRSLRLGSLPTGEKRDLNREVRIRNSELNDFIAKNLSGFDSSLMIHVWLSRIGYITGDPISMTIMGLDYVSESDQKLDLRDESTLDRNLWGDPTYAYLNLSIRKTQ